MTISRNGGESGCPRKPDGLVVLYSIMLMGIIIALFLGMHNWHIYKNPDPYILTCQTILEDNLISPLSLKVDYAETSNTFAGDIKTVIEYNAANAYGTLLRGNIECIYSQPDSSDDDPMVEGGFSGAKAASDLIEKVTLDGEVLVEACLDEESDDCSLQQSLGLIVLKTRTFNRLSELEKR